MNEAKMNPKDLPYRDGVGVMLVGEHGKILVARRIDTRSEAWQMPQGGIDEGEAPFECALRELMEEIGTNNAELIAESADWYYYDLPEHLVSKIWGGRYRGQRQKWFLMRFTGTDADINLETEHPEFCEWKWAEPQTLPALIVPFKQKLYAELLEEFGAKIAAL
jgi:putative (di)nucleoside polyphosphate hydrolase